MTDKVFIDTNIWLYAFMKQTGEELKHQKAKVVILGHQENVISSQVISELCSNLFRKGNFTENEVFQIIEDLYRGCEVQETSLTIHLRASELRAVNGFSFWDSLIIAAALEAGCSKLMTEDLQNGQLIANQLKVLNPFVEV